MARKGKPRSFFEPWVAAKSTQHGKSPFPDGTIPDGYPEGVGEKILESWQRADDRAPWLIWGSKMVDPTVVKNFDGTISVMNDQRIITVFKALGLADGSPSQEDMARRIAACVNACAGIADPEKFIADTRALMLAYVQGEGNDPRSDNRVVGLLGRCIPLEELEKYHAESEDSCESGMH